MERAPEENPAPSAEASSDVPEDKHPDAAPTPPADPPRQDPEDAAPPVTEVAAEPSADGDRAEPAGASDPTPASEDAPPSPSADSAPAAEPETAATAEPETAATAEPSSNGPAMAELMEDKAAAPAPDPKPGARVRGKIVKLGEDAAFVDFGGREEAALDLREIRDPDGKLTRKVGDEIQGTITSVKGGLRISVRSGRSVPKNLPMLIQAASAGTAIDGKVTSVNKGGLVVHVMGVRAFCPFSQIDRHYVEDPSVFVGKKLTFRVSSADEKGRNVVLSRRALLEEEAKANAEQLRSGLEVGAVVRGVVARIRPFGAFVDLGGIDGLLHVSEISHSRVNDPSKVLQLGQEVEVKVRSVEGLGTKDERVGLSLKEMQADPWEEAVRELNVGERVKARVVRLAPFGAFLEIFPGVDGLAHVSTLADGHVAQPSDVIKVGDEVEPWVLSVDRDARRISLSLMEPRAASADSGERRSRPRREDRRSQRDPAQREHKTGPVGSPGMTSMQEAFERLKSRMDR